jgi:hypothetical protein
MRLFLSEMMLNSTMMNSKFLLFYLIIANFGLIFILLFSELNQTLTSFFGMLILSFPVGFVSIHYFKKKPYSSPVIIVTSIIFGFVLNSLWSTSSSYFLIHPIITLIPYLITNGVLFYYQIIKYLSANSIELNNYNFESFTKFKKNDVFFLVFISISMILFVSITYYYTEPIDTGDLGRHHVRISEDFLKFSKVDLTHVNQGQGYGYPIGFHSNVASYSDLFHIDPKLMSQTFILFLLYLVFVVFTTASYVLSRSLIISISVMTSFFFIPEVDYWTSLFGTIFPGLGPYLLGLLYALTGLLLLIVIKQKNNFLFFITLISLFLGIVYVYPPFIIYFGFGVLFYLIIQYGKIKTKTIDLVKDLQFFKLRNFNFLHILFGLIIFNTFFNRVYEISLYIVKSADPINGAIGYSNSYVYKSNPDSEFFVVFAIIIIFVGLFYFKSSKLIACILFSITIIPSVVIFFLPLDVYFVPFKVSLLIPIFSWFLVGIFIRELNDRLIQNEFVNTVKSFKNSILTIIINYHVLSVSFLIASLIFFGSNILDIFDLNSYYYQGMK